MLNPNFKSKPSGQARTCALPETAFPGKARQDCKAVRRKGLTEGDGPTPGGGLERLLLKGTCFPSAAFHDDAGMVVISCILVKRNSLAVSTLSNGSERRPLSSCCAVFDVSRKPYKTWYA